MNLVEKLWNNFRDRNILTIPFGDSTYLNDFGEKIFYAGMADLLYQLAKLQQEYIGREEEWPTKNQEILKDIDDKLGSYRSTGLIEVEKHNVSPLPKEDKKLSRIEKFRRKIQSRKQESEDQPPLLNALRDSVTKVMAATFKNYIISGKVVACTAATSFDEIGAITVTSTILVRDVIFKDGNKSRF